MIFTMFGRLMLLFLFPLCAAAAVVTPSSVGDVQTISEPGKPQEYFGALSGFPHTFEFSVGDTQPFSASVYVYDTSDATPRAVLLLTKKEKRGVSEVGRTKGKGEAWETVDDAWLRLPLRDGGTLTSDLQTGTYLMEISSPDNDARYRVVINGYGGGWYGTRLATLFSVYSLYDIPFYRAVLSPLVYLPLLLIAAIGAFVWYRRKRAR
jgi:hypothetical protein